jgi:6-phosphofructokinase
VKSEAFSVGVFLETKHPDLNTLSHIERCKISTAQNKFKELTVGIASVLFLEERKANGKLI